MTDVTKKKAKGDYLFKKGVSGNPAGRKKGAPSPYSKFKKQLLNDGGQEVVDEVIRQAKLGIDWACRLCIERMIPKATDSGIDIDVDSLLENIQSSSPAVQNFIESMKGASVNLTEAMSIIKLLEGQGDDGESLSDVILRLNNTKRKYQEA